MSMSSYVVGDLVKLTAFFAVAGVATDPTSVTCEVIDPLGVTTTPAVTKDSTGNYHATVDLTTAFHGVWTYRIVGTGACQAAQEAQFYVGASAF